MAFGDADRDVFIEAAVFGVTVVYGGTTTTGAYDELTEDLLDGHVVAQEGIQKSVLVKTGAFSPSLGGAITVAGTAYTVRDIRQEGPDGRLTRVFLAG